jgi:hypothetical protein
MMVRPKSVHSPLRARSTSASEAGGALSHNASGMRDTCASSTLAKG